MSRTSITDRDFDWIPNEVEDNLPYPGPFDPDDPDTDNNYADDANDYATYMITLGEPDWVFWEEVPPAAVPKTIEYDWGANGTQCNR